MRQTTLFYKADPDYGVRVAEGPDFSLDGVTPLVEMSQEERGKATVA